jgi:C-terminal processing protease CtpA/Prc
VLSDSPAERGGVQRGDVVTHFNGQPLIDRDCNTSPMGQLIVTVERDGVMLDLDLDVIPLVE